MQRCENEAWPSSKRAGLFRGATKISGLYFAVIALGAINASSNETSLLEHFCQQSVDRTQTNPWRPIVYTALDFAKFFFGLAKRTLGNLFESSCLESAQTLLLLVCLCRILPWKDGMLSCCFRACSGRIHCSLIAVICTAGWLPLQQRLLDSARVCLRCLLVLDEKLGAPGGTFHMPKDDRNED